ncbi:ParA family protein [Rothia sp. P6271]|uniref:ParA family protein n=1 Tax=Rothia sp. P6271 TaxID=3402659 RepID=UPI003ACF3B11
MPLIVSISSLKGGVGKTSVTLGLTSAALHAGQKVLVIDLDPHGDASTGLGVPTTGADIGSMLAAPDRFSFTDNIVSSGWNAIAQEHENSGGVVHVVRGSASSTPLEQAPLSQYLPRLLNLLQGNIDDYDVVFIDCPPTLGVLTSMAWAASDRVISVAEPSLFSVAGTERTLRAITRFEENSQYSVSSASVILNKVRPHSSEHSYRVEEMKVLFGDLVADQFLEDFEEFQRVQGSAYPVHYWPSDDVRRCAAVFSDILQGLK